MHPPFPLPGSLLSLRLLVCLPLPYESPPLSFCFAWCFVPFALVSITCFSPRAPCLLLSRVLIYVCVWLLCTQWGSDWPDQSKQREETWQRKHVQHTHAHTRTQLCVHWLTFISCRLTPDFIITTTCLTFYCNLNPDLTFKYVFALTLNDLCYGVSLFFHTTWCPHNVTV